MKCKGAVNNGCALPRANLRVGGDGDVIVTSGTDQPRRRSLTTSKVKKRRPRVHGNVVMNDPPIPTPLVPWKHVPRIAIIPIPRNMYPEVNKERRSHKAHLSDSPLAKK